MSLHKKISLFIISSRNKAIGAILLQPFLGTSFYFYSIGVAPLPLVASFFSLFYVFNSRKRDGVLVDRNTDNLKKYLAGFVFLLLIYSFFVSFAYFFAEYTDIRPHSFVGVLLGGATLLAVEKYAAKSFGDFLFNIQLFLSLSLLFFYIQFILYFFFDINTDYMVGVTGEEQRLNGYSRDIEGVGAFIRSSGIFAEPAVYATVTVSLVVCLLYNNRCNVVLFWLSIVSIFLSFSSTGVALSIIPILMAVVVSKRTRWFVILCLLVLVFFYWDSFNDLFSNEFQRLSSVSTDESGSSRFLFVDHLMNNVNVFVFGYGILTDLRDIVPPSLFLSSVIYAFGFPGFLVLFSLFVVLALRMFSFFGVFLIVTLGLLVNFPIPSPFFWLVFSIFYSSLQRDRALCFKNI